MKAMRIAVRPYGVLGEALTATGVRKVAAAPAPGHPIVDPAGLEFVRARGPRGAGGASGAVYAWLGIAGDAAFPAAVRAAIAAPAAAKLHYYGQKAVPRPARRATVGDEAEAPPLSPLSPLRRPCCTARRPTCATPRACARATTRSPR